MTAEEGALAQLATACALAEAAVPGRRVDDEALAGVGGGNLDRQGAEGGVGAREAVERTEVMKMLGLQAREAVFQAAMRENDLVTRRVLRQCLLKVQRQSVSALNLVVVAELAAVCGVVDMTRSEAETLKHVAALLQDEIQRVGSPRLVFEMMQVMLLELDAGLKKRGLHVFVGSVLESMRSTFQFLKRLVLMKREVLKSNEFDQQSETSDATEDVGFAAEMKARKRRLSSKSEDSEPPFISYKKMRRSCDVVAADLALAH